MTDLSNKIKGDFFPTVAVAVLLYGYTTLTLIKRIEKKLDGNNTTILGAVLNKSWKQHPTKQLRLISKTIQIRQTRNAGHCCRSNEELISDVL